MSARSPAGFVAWLALAAAVALGSFTAPTASAQFAPSRLSAVANWGYQLQNVDPAAVAASRFDLMVIDPTRDGETPFKAAAIAQMQSRADGGRRTVLAYLSIGEAEDYRPYWQPRWNKYPPPWLAAENPNWQGNFKVRYWHPEWQAMVFAALDVIVAAGFRVFPFEDRWEVRIQGEGRLNFVPQCEKPRERAPKEVVPEPAQHGA